MNAVSTKRQLVFNFMGIEEAGRYIEKGDKCIVGNITKTMLIPVTYPVSKGMRSAYVKSLVDFRQG